MHTKIAAIQMTAGMDVDHNLATAQKLLKDAAQQGASVAVLPEMFPILGRGPEFDLAKSKIQEKEGEGKIQSFLSQAARELKLWIVGGTIPLTTEDPNRPCASCLVFNDRGESVARYNKIHLFDVTLSDDHAYRESDSHSPGSEIVVIDSPVGVLGLSVCYDVRFPELFRAMSARGAQIMIIPAAFIVPTGRLHWEVLLRARAIENCAYVVASAQWGVHGQGRETYGDSMIIAPTGKIIERLPTGEGLVTAEIDLNFLQSERQKIPAWGLRVI